MRPKQCVPAEEAVTHSVCVCTIHQNAKLMFAGAKLGKLTEGTENQTHDLKTCVAMLLCDAPPHAYYIKKCHECGNATKLIEKLQIVSDENDVGRIEFKKWTLQIVLA